MGRYLSGDFGSSPGTPSSGPNGATEEFIATPAQTDFVVSHVPLSGTVFIVAINGLIAPSTAFSVASQTITLTDPATEDDRITVVYQYA